MGRSGSHMHGQSPALQRAQAAIAAATSGGGGRDAIVATDARPLQTLWAGYGSVYEVSTDEDESLIIKEVAPPQGAS